MALSLSLKLPPTDGSITETRNQTSKLLGRCSGCRKKFEWGSDSYASPTNDKERLCEACAVLVYPVCVLCEKPGVDDMAKIGDKIYHTHCLHCVVCSETIAGKAFRIKDDFLCCKCNADMRAEAVRSNRLAKRGDKRGASKIRRELLAKGLKVSNWEKEFPMEQNAEEDKSCAISMVQKMEVIRCAMCSKIVTGKVAEIGSSMLCYSCALCANNQIQKAKRLLVSGEGTAADDIFHVLARHGIDPNPHLSNSICSICSAPIHEEGAQMGTKTLCPRCADDVEHETEEVHDLAAQGDIAGVSKLIHTMEEQGLVQSGKADLMAAGSQNKGAVCSICHGSIPGYEGQAGQTLVCLSCHSKSKNANDDIETNNSFASLMASSLKEEGLELPPVLASRLGKSPETANASSSDGLVPAVKSVNLDSSSPQLNRPSSSIGTSNQLAGRDSDEVRAQQSKDGLELPHVISRQTKDDRLEHGVVDGSEESLTPTLPKPTAPRQTKDARLEHEALDGNEVNLTPILPKGTVQTKDARLDHKALDGNEVSLTPILPEATAPRQTTDARLKHGALAGNEESLIPTLPKATVSSRQDGSELDKRMSIPRDRLVETFKNWDSNGDGHICEKELKKVFQKLGIATADIHKVFSSIDSNKDGHIDYCEFVDWLFASPAIRRHIKGSTSIER